MALAWQLMACQLVSGPMTPGPVCTEESKVTPGVFETAAPAAAATALDSATLEERGAVIRQITIRTGDIFDREDPHENNRVYRFANRLHRTTRDLVIERHLLFAPGDRYSQYRIDESERILRSQRYLYEAEIVPVAVEGRFVDLEIRTRDVWTLKAGFSASRSGGANETKVVLQDSNFLGTGKEVTLKHTSDVDRSGYLARYRDKNVGGSRVELELNYRDNDDGEFQKVKLIRPFYSLETRWAAGFQMVLDDRIDTLYSLGEIVSEFRQEEMFAEAWVGKSKGLKENFSRRWLLGFTYEEDLFSPKPTQSGQSLPPPLGQDVVIAKDQFPDRNLADRKLMYPWLGFELIENRFQKTHDLDGLHRTEDLELGHRLSARLGWSAPTFGATDEKAIFRAGYSFGGARTDRKLFFFDGGVDGRLGSDGVENLLLGISGRFYWRNIRDHTFLAKLTLQAAENLDAENQLLLGGDTGLRGFPLRYQEGDRRALFTAEQRFYTDWHPFRLAYVGAAIFVDSGQAWIPGRQRDSDLGWLTNVGLGLRLSPSRSGFGSMVHLDVAFPLGAPGDIDSVQFLISSRETF